MMTWKHHKKKWSDCERCDLCKTRNKVVLLKGKIPCDILFIGEAPGVSEDSLGKPFIGPAGHLLDRIIKESLPETTRLAFTNLVACIPVGEDGNKLKEPDKKSIRECRERLDEVISLCQPSAIVCVGKLPAKYLKKEDFPETEIETITHPASIIRMDVSQKGLAIQKAIIILQDLSEEIQNDSTN